MTARSEPKQCPQLAPDEAHPRARELLTDAFFWDASDPCGPFGNETAVDVLEALEDRIGGTEATALDLLDELLTRWEIANDHWDIVDADAVQEVGEQDELGLLTRDEAILGLAFAQIVFEGRVHAEVRRRAMLALSRQTLPALLHGWGEHAMTRAARLDRMRQVLVRAPS